MKQTAVQFLQDCLNIHFTFEQQMQFEGLFQQAKQMEKQQIIWAHGVQMKGVNNHKCITGEQYYNETYNLSQQHKP